MYKTIKKIAGLILVTMLLGSNFAFIDFAGAETGEIISETGSVEPLKNFRAEKITFCHVPPGDIDNPQTITTSINAYNNGHSNHELDYLGECIEPEPMIATILADKIVCDDESYLPNWGEGGQDITETTAAEFLAMGDNSEHCELVRDWKFQWSLDKSNPGDDFVGESGDGWTTFMGSTQIEIDDMDSIWIREVLEDGYIPFTYNLNGKTNVDNISAEMYCYKDVINYDNYDSITFDEEEDTYNCIAFNVEKEKTTQIIVDKIVCNDESLLPNGSVKGSSYENTASEFLSNLSDEDKDNCWLEPDWEFQWGYPGVNDDGDTLVGPATSTGWNTFSSSVNIPSEGIDGVNIREILEEGYLPFAPEDQEKITAELYCETDGGGKFDNEEWIRGGFDKDKYHCIAFNYKDPKKTIHADKIVCDDEMYLPNWGADGGDDINENTASDFVAASNGHCELVDWDFEWALSTETNPGDELIGVAGEGWNTFSGLAEIDPEDDEKFWVREVLKDGYIPFSFEANGYTNVDNYTAEMYCHNNVVNYDNYDYISLDENIDNYYCVAFNYMDPILEEAFPVCEDGKKYAKITLDEVDGLVPANNTIWFGDSIAPVGVWFELPMDEDTSSHTEGIVFTYGGDVLTLDLLKFADDSRQDIAGTIEFYGTELDGNVSTNGLENSGLHPDVFEKQANNLVRFDFATTSGDDQGSILLKDKVEMCAPPILEEAEPTCEDGNRYMKISINEASGGLDTVDDTVWFGDYIAPIDTWFMLPNDADTSSQTEGAVLTYDDNILTIDLLKADDNSEEHFAGTIMFYGAKVKGNIVEGREGDLFYKLEDGTGNSHLDIIEKDGNQKVDFDFSTTNANDEGSMKIKDNIEYCNDPFKIVAYKIVCEDEDDLPDHFGGELDKIQANTASNWVKEHDSCRFVEGWDFQYGYNNTDEPTGDLVGEADVGDWMTFGPTNFNGRTVFSTMDLEGINRIKVREVLQEDYIPFTDTKGSNEPEYTAEIYCGTDILNYDNIEYIDGDDLGYGQKVFCIAWNVPKGPDPLAMCQNDFSVNNDKDLSIIDLLTGNQTYVNDLAFGSSASGVDPVTGNVYYIEKTSSNPRLGMYDITNHENTEIGYTNAVGKIFTKMAFDSNGVLYAMTDYQNSSLYTINTTTGEATYVDGTPLVNKSGGDFIFDDQGDLYVLVKDGKLFRVDVTVNSTSATFVGYVMHDGDKVQSTGLTFKDGLFYASDNNNNLFSFNLGDISNATKITDNTNIINDLASCPVIVREEPEQEPEEEPVQPQTQEEPLLKKKGSLSYRSEGDDSEEGDDSKDSEEGDDSDGDDNVGKKHKRAVSGLVKKLDKFSQSDKQRLIIKLLKKVQKLEDKFQGDEDALEKISYFKAQLIESFKGEA